MASPYLAALRTLNLYEGYNHIDELIADYDSVMEARVARLAAEREKEEALALERKYDRENHAARKRLGKKYISVYRCADTGTGDCYVYH